MFFIVDSDDYLSMNAIEIIEYEWSRYGNPSLLGICMRRVDPMTNEIIGRPFPTNKRFALPETINFVWNISSDKAEIFSTSVVRENTFPEYKDEKFCTEALWVYQISKKTKKQYLVSNQGIRYTEYLDDGLTKNRRRIKKENPFGYIQYYKMLLSLPEFYLHPRRVIFVLLDLVRLNVYLIKKGISKNEFK